MNPGIGECKSENRREAESTSQSLPLNVNFPCKEHPLTREIGVPFPSIWGHWAGGPGDSVEDVKWLDQKLADFFAKN